MVWDMAASLATDALVLMRAWMGLLVRQEQIGAKMELECARVQGREGSMLLLRDDIGSWNYC